VGSISDEVWFLHVAVFVVLRFYVSVVLLQALRRLLRNARIEAEWAERRRSHSRPSENGNENFSSIEVQASSPSPSPTSDRDLVGELELRTSSRADWKPFRDLGLLLRAASSGCCGPGLVRAVLESLSFEHQRLDHICHEGSNVLHD
jgi:hypothetical protein